MPVDANAYMGGAIPGLSRGGSWHPGEDSSNPSNSRYASTAAPGSPAMPWANPMWVPRTPYTFNPHNPSLAHLPSLRTPRSPGLQNPYVQNNSPNSPLTQHSPRTALTPSGATASPMSPLTPRSARPAASVGGSTYRPPTQYAGWASDPLRRAAGHSREAVKGAVSVASQGGKQPLQPAFRRDEGEVWERQSGAPVPVSPEPNYKRREDPYLRPHRPVTEILPSTLIPDKEPHCSGRKKSSPDPPRFRPNLPRHYAVESSRSPPLPPLDDRARPRLTLDGYIKLGPEWQEGHKSLEPAPISTCSTCALAEPRSPNKNLSRPSLLRRHTHDDPFITPPGSPKQMPKTHTPLARQRHLSNPVLREQRVDSFASSSSTSQDYLDLAPLSAALSVRERTKLDAPPGYISPLSYEGYDRYAAHPAVPTPHQGTRTSHTDADDFTVVPEPAIPPSAARNGPGDKTYLPLGYARPTREIGWNRNGPAMKTYGVAWGREAGPVLPAGPRGPSWVVARPPRGRAVSGGSWWESGGEAS